jgi:hypothetical protein
VFKKYSEIFRSVREDPVKRKLVRRSLREDPVKRKLVRRSLSILSGIQKAVENTGQLMQAEGRGKLPACGGRPAGLEAAFFPLEGFSPRNPLPNRGNVVII